MDLSAGLLGLFIKILAPFACRSGTDPLGNPSSIPSPRRPSRHYTRPRSWCMYLTQGPSGGSRHFSPSSGTRPCDRVMVLGVCNLSSGAHVRVVDHLFSAGGSLFGPTGLGR